MSAVSNRQTESIRPVAGGLLEAVLGGRFDTGVRCLASREDVVDVDVDGDGAQTDVVAEFTNDVALDTAGDVLDDFAVADGDCEVDDGGAAQNAHR